MVDCPLLIHRPSVYVMPSNSRSIAFWSLGLSCRVAGNAFSKDVRNLGIHTRLNEGELADSPSNANSLHTFYSLLKPLMSCHTLMDILLRGVQPASIVTANPLLMLTSKLCSCRSLRPLASIALGTSCSPRWSSSKSRWKQRQGRDMFAREAKVQGLKSRAAFKLLEVCVQTALVSSRKAASHSSKIANDGQDGFEIQLFQTWTDSS